MKGGSAKGTHERGRREGGMLHEGTHPSVNRMHPTGMHSYFSIVHECKVRGVYRLIHRSS